MPIEAHTNITNTNSEIKKYFNKRHITMLDLVIPSR